MQCDQIEYWFGNLFQGELKIEVVAITAGAVQERVYIRCPFLFLSSAVLSIQTQVPVAKFFNQQTSLHIS
jgi:hypothetical protein